MSIVINTSAVDRIDIAAFTPHIPEEYRFFFFAPPGVAPYRLLAHLSTLFDDQTLVEVGVHNGWGCMALSHNPRNRVVGFDVDLDALSPVIRDTYRTVRYVEGLAHKAEPALLLSTPFIHFDARHDGVYEQVFFDWLVDHRYRGLLLLDDIHLNKAMQRFWDGIPGVKRDLTIVGHDTGTGLVCMGGVTVDVI
jgi:hypothetical protein